MTVWLLWAGAGVAGGLGTHLVAHRMVAGAPLLRRNYRGIEVPAAAGIAVLVGIVLGAGVVGFVHAIAPGARTPSSAAAVGLPALAAAMGFGLLGLWDDIAAGPERGWRGHVRSLVRGKASSGALKLVAGVGLAIAIVSPLTRSFGWTLVGAGVLAMMANVHNLLDVRPGRACKAYVLAAVPMLAIGGPTAPALAAGLGAAIAFLRFDLRERGMLGDAGANGLGALAGIGVVLLGSHLALLATFGVLVVLHALADGPSLSKGIDRIPPLRALDRAGRVPE